VAPGPRHPAPGSAHQLEEDGFLTHRDRVAGLDGDRSAVQPPDRAHPRSRGGGSGTALRPADRGIVPAAGFDDREHALPDVVREVDRQPGADSPSAIAAQIAASGADTIISIIEPGAFVEILNALRAIGRGPKVAMSLSGYSDQMLHTLRCRRGRCGGPALLPALRVRWPGDPTDMFLRGLELAGPCPTRQGFIDALHSVTNYDAGGLITPLNVRDEFGKPTTCYAFTQVNPQGNAFTVAEQRLCGKSLAP
jgi:branched-chain amino acid transport system substrate-binding protein